MIQLRGDVEGLWDFFFVVGGSCTSFQQQYSSTRMNIANSVYYLYFIHIMPRHHL